MLHFFFLHTFCVFPLLSVSVWALHQIGSSAAFVLSSMAVMELPFTRSTAVHFYAQKRQLPQLNKAMLTLCLYACNCRAQKKRMNHQIGSRSLFSIATLSYSGSRES